MNKSPLYKNIVVFLWLYLSLMASTSYGLSTGWLKNPQQPEAKVRLLLSGESNVETGTVQAVLGVSLSKGWKTYWRSPGEAGLPATIDWRIGEERGSKNLKSVDWLWPVPERLELLGLHTLGYYGDVAFPLVLHVDDINQPVDLQGKLRLSSCTTICVLTDYEINLTFEPSKLKWDSDAAFLLDKAISRVPGYMPDTGLAVDNIIWDQSTDTVLVTATSELQWHPDADVIIDGQEDITFSVPDIHLDGQTLEARFKTSSWLGEYDLKNQPVLITLMNSDSASEVSLKINAGKIQPAVVETEYSYLLLLGMALLGGLILNLMPCVLPVLGIKLSSVVQASGQQALQTRKQFLSSAAGIITSFWILAVFLWLLKLAGSSVGWGIQFQNPYFIGFMVAVTALFTANLLDMFDVRLPASASTRLAAAGNESTTGHFIQGMFATLLATPCSAPFLGTAVAFALSGSGFDLWAIFTTMGIGLALPYLLIAAKPSLLNWLPKPGRWMLTLRRVLAVMLMITMLWLMTLLNPYLSTLWILLAALVVVSLFIHRLLVLLLPDTQRILRFIPTLCFSLVMVLAAAWFTGLIDKKAETDSLKWVSLNEQSIQQQITEGKIVFVDVTADWCVTCKANKIRVIDRDPVNNLLQSDKVVTMKGDWTQPSEEINAFLQKHGRFGVPFNIVYGPDATKGIPLPVVLDSNTVMKAVMQAGGVSEKQ